MASGIRPATPAGQGSRVTAVCDLDAGARDAARAELPEALRGSDKLSLMIDNQRTTLLNGGNASPQLAVAQARSPSRPRAP